MQATRTAAKYVALLGKTIVQAAKWASNLRYIRISEGWLYLAVIQHLNFLRAMTGLSAKAGNAAWHLGTKGNHRCAGAAQELHRAYRHSDQRQSGHYSNTDQAWLSVLAKTAWLECDSDGRKDWLVTGLSCGGH